MHELATILGVLAFIYLLECAVWCRRGGAGFAQGWRGHWRLVSPAYFFGNHRGGMLLANPLPPFCTVVVVPQFSVSMDEAGVLSYSAACWEGNTRPAAQIRHWRWEQIENVQLQGAKILINGKLFFHAESSYIARFWSRAVNEIRRMPAKEREPAIQKLLAGAFDQKQIEERLQFWKDQTNGLRSLCLALFLFLFCVGPLLVWRLSFQSTWIGLLFALLTLTISISALLHRAHKRLYPDAGEERFALCLTMALSPATAIRATDVLGRPVLSGFHAVAAAKQLCSPAEFIEFAGKVMRDLRHPLLPLLPVDDAPLEKTEASFRERLTAQVESFLSKSKVPQAEISPRQKALEKANRSYCPRCLSQFTLDSGTCNDCGGCPLLPLES